MLHTIKFYADLGELKHLSALAAKRLAHVDKCLRLIGAARGAPTDLMHELMHERATWRDLVAMIDGEIGPLERQERRDETSHKIGASVRARLARLRNAGLEAQPRRARRAA